MNLGHESELLEFKKSTSELKEGVGSIASILNKHQRGVLYFGVNPNGDVCGQDVTESTLRQISQSIGNFIDPCIYPEIEPMNDGAGHDFVKVSFRGDEVPYACRGIYRIRVADEDVLMSQGEVRRMATDAEDRQRPWDRRASARSIKDVDEDALRAYIERGRACGRISFAYEGASDALERLGLMDGGVLTNAADVLFCRSQIPMLKMGVFANHERIDIIDIQQEQGNLFELARKAEFYVLSNVRRRVEFDGNIERREIPELPMEAVREAIVNGFAHRSYRSDLAMQVEIYPGSVEIFSPGWFPDGHAPEAHLSGEDKSSNSRNKLIASTLFKSKDIESFATGMPRLQKLCDAAGVPVRDERNVHGTVVVFVRKNAFADNPPAPASARQRPPAPASATTIAWEKLDQNEIAVCEYLAGHSQAKAAEIAEEAGIKRRTLADVLKRLGEKNLVIASGASTSRTYSLRNESVL